MPSNQGYEQLKSDEGFHPKAEVDRDEKGRPVGNKVIGYGYNLQANNPREDLISIGVSPDEVDDVISGKAVITEEQGQTLFQLSISRAVSDARRVVESFDDLDPKAKDVLVNMSYQMGAKGLREFKKMRRAIREGDYQKAAKELMNSDFAQRQTPNRAERLAKQLSSLGKQEPEPPKQNEDALKSRLSQAYHQHQLKTRLESAMRKSPPTPEPEEEDGKVEPKARKEDTPDA